MENFGAFFGKLIRSSVGNNFENQEADVLRVKGALSNLGHYKKKIENGIIDQELDSAIHSFQREKGLKVDGYMNPGGETEQSIVNTTLDKAQKNASKKSEVPLPTESKPDKKTPSEEGDGQLYDEKEKRQICIDIWKKIFAVQADLAEKTRYKGGLEENIKNMHSRLSALKEKSLDPSEIIKINSPKNKKGKRSKYDVLEGILNGVEIGETIDNYQDIHEEIINIEGQIESMNLDIQSLEDEIVQIRQNEEDLLEQADALDCSPI
jgi:peptidoglycan hydrolase-like protein with peptidoglycan-binding domain